MKRVRIFPNVLSSYRTLFYEWMKESRKKLKFCQVILNLFYRKLPNNCLLGIKGLFSRSVLEFWVLGIGYWKKNWYSRCFWLTGYWKITVNCSMPNSPTLILFCLTGHWKNYGVSDIQYPTLKWLNTQYPTVNTFLPDCHWKVTVYPTFCCIFFLVKNSRVLLYLF